MKDNDENACFKVLSAKNEDKDTEHNQLGDKDATVLKHIDIGVKSTTVAEVVFCWIHVKNVVLIDKVMHCEKDAAKWSDQRGNLRENTHSTIDD